MKKVIMLLLLVISLCSFVACKETEKVGLERIIDKGTLVVGFTDYPPYGYEEDGEYYGFDLEVAKLVCKELNVEFVPKLIDWDAKVEELKTNIDCIWNAFTISEKFKDEISFTKPYWKTNLVAVVTKDSEISKVDDLEGKKIAVETNSTGDLSISGNDSYTVDRYTRVSEALLAIKSGQADALVVDATYATDVLNKYTDEYKICEGTIGEIEEYGIGFRKAEKDLCDKVDEIIDKLYEEGKLDTILAKYFGESNGFIR